MEQVFKPDIWHEFDEITNNGKCPYLFKSLLNTSDSIVHSKLVEKALISLIQNNHFDDKSAKVRVYKGETRRDDLISSIFSAEINEKTDLERFAKEKLNTEKFSLVVNNLENVKGELSALLGDFIQSFFHVKGFPIGGSEQVAFCGNYSGTAFGIHEGYEHAFLCHFGPGTKHFYCWSREEYIAIAGDRKPTFSNSEKYDQLLKCGQLFKLEPGDVLYLPASVYHIGRQDEYSISVALPIYTYPLTRFTSGLVLPALSQTTMPFDLEGMSLHYKAQEPSQITTHLKEVLDQSYHHWSNTLLESFTSYYWYKLITNGGWELPLNVRNNPTAIDELGPHLDIDIGNRIRIKKPYQVFASRELDCAADEARFFLAGMSVVSKVNGVEIDPIIKELNNHTDFIVTSDTMVQITQALSRTGAVELKNHELRG